MGSTEQRKESLLKYYTASMSMYGHHTYASMDQPGTVANPVRGQLNRENEYFSDLVRT